MGDISDWKLLHNQLLVAVYIKPNVTAGGIFLTDNTLKEDEYQGKVGLVVKVGPTAFMDTQDESFEGQNVQVGDWVVYRTGDGWQLTIRDTACRILTDRTVRMVIPSPGVIY